MAIGNCCGLHNSLSVGVISALGRTLRGEATELQASFIIVAVNGERISNPGDISRAIVASGPGREISLRVLRGSQLLMIRLTLPEMRHPSGN